MTKAGFEEKLQKYREEQKTELDKITDPSKKKWHQNLAIGKQILFQQGLVKELQKAYNKADEYLSDEVKSRVRNYKWFSPSGWYDWSYDKVIGTAHVVFGFKPSERLGLYKRQLANLQGPGAIKAKQKQVQSMMGNKEFCQGMLELLNDKKLISETIDVISNKFYKAMAKTASFVAVPLFKMLLRKGMRNVDDLAPLQNKVPFLPYSYFKETLEKTKADFNKDSRYSSDPINSIDTKPVASGSIGQVFVAKRKSGKQIILKVIRKDANKKFFEDSRQYSFYLGMIELGTKLHQKLEAKHEVDKNVHFLVKEADLNHENMNAQNAASDSAWLKTLTDGLNKPAGTEIEHKIVTPLFVDQNGSCKVEEFYGNQDFTDMKSADVSKIKSRLIPGVLRRVLLSPHQPLDLHDGNFRDAGAAKAVGWIDHGRQANLNKNVHAGLLKLITAFYSANEKYGLVIDQAASQPSVIQALKNGDRSEDK